ncbi:GATA zinc finger [Apiospora rasikravindrae]|uniref:GATA zinc finger n=1 Tax=Apiospora rasikravindrae TaxID=990691 RepID=A0ABR1RN41_9PEZI
MGRMAVYAPPNSLNDPNLNKQSNPPPLQIAAADNSNDMTDLLNSPMYSNFDAAAGIPMNLDLDLDMPPPPQPSAFASSSTGSNVPPSTMGQSEMEDSPAAQSSNGFGTPAAQSNANPGSNTLTEFTKRRNWPAKVVEELKDFLQILDAHGRIKYVSPSVTTVTGYQSEDIIETFLKELIHPDDVGTFTSEMNESIATGHPLRMFYRLKKKDGQYAIFESVGHAHIASAKFAPNPDNQTPFCQAVFIMSRPYPTRNAQLLDSFLEHKIENERLRRRIAELRREEEEEEASQKSWLAAQEASDMAASEDMQSSVGTSYYQPTQPDTTSMPPPERPSSLSMSLTRENLEGAAGSRSDSIKDKMARFEGASHTDTIEMLTGLRYVEGERSRGITTGNHSPTLIRGDAGIAIPIDRDPRTGEKKKKLKVAEEYVCTDCGTLDSPEWRKGPSGPKTLCNACGLRWAKKEKKKNTSNGTGKETPQMPSVETQ